MKYFLIIVSFLIFNTLRMYSQDKYNVTIKLELDTIEQELPKSLLFFPVSIYKENGTTYKVGDLDSGTYKLRVNIINYEILVTNIKVGKHTDNNHTIKLNRISNPYSFESDLEKGNLMLFLEVRGPTTFYGTEVSKKFKSKFDVAIVSSFTSCLKENTNYDLQYSREVASYLDEKYGNKWRKFLMKYDLKPFE
ncbi:FEKKY domain-containing protein [Marinigracilibium pacificum]|uniref:Uncharacterized protein n=1 Tax=Marinigracilibium pacificum TaxID=2729599 RepID=A0A848J4W7_9BACT|nr:hypothetical protein [Marinigracilibium pacificum]NMM50821.1 hypothetical protein [Marinigracilibium pacificum]